MSQVSVRYIVEERKKRIIKLLKDLIIKTKSNQDTEILVNDLLTSTEKIMLSKRLACFYLISNNVDLTDISDILKLSKSTVFYYKNLYKTKKNLKKYLETKIFKEKIGQTLKNIFIEFYYNNPKKGSDWSASRKVYYENQRRKKEKI